MGIHAEQKVMHTHMASCRRFSNYIYILDLTSGFNGLEKDNCKTRQETFLRSLKELVRLILED